MRDIPRAWYVVGAVVALVGLLAVIGAVSGGANNGGDSDSATTVVYTVVVDTTTDVSLTYTNANGNTEQLRTRVEVLVPWKLQLTMQSGDFVYISAQRGAGSGTIRCTINAGNQRIERAESSGEFVIASCSGSVP